MLSGGSGTGLAAFLIEPVERAVDIGRGAGVAGFELAVAVFVVGEIGWARRAHASEGLQPAARGVIQETGWGRHAHGLSYPWSGSGFFLAMRAGEALGLVAQPTGCANLLIVSGILRRLGKMVRSFLRVDNLKPPYILSSVFMASGRWGPVADCH